jgi:hypothetical protein
MEVTSCPGRNLDRDPWASGRQSSRCYPDALGPVDERQLIQRRLIEDPVAVGGPPRSRQQPGTLINRTIDGRNSGTRE